MSDSLLAFLQEQRWIALEGVRVHYTLVPYYFFNFYRAGSAESGSKLYIVEQDPLAELQLRNVLWGVARVSLENRLHQLAAAKGLPRPRVSVRDQRSRWGSRSSTGTICLNWRLLLLEPCLQDYVIWHELAHITEMNHGAEFWRLLESYDPYTREHERQLKAVGKRIIGLGRAERPEILLGRQTG